MPVATFSAFLLPYGLAFAARAMVVVVCDEMIPESHSGGFETAAAAGLMIGFVVMMVLDNLFALAHPEKGPIAISKLDPAYRTR